MQVVVDRAKALREALVARRASQGYNEADSRTLLADLLRRHSGNNLVTALVYNGFATQKQAEAVRALIS